jgi:NHLM bacteriocin system secretion protein
VEARAANPEPCRRPWLALLGGGLILAALAWGVFGQVPTRVNGSGVLLPLGGYAGDEELKALLYVDAREGKNIKPGMAVEVAPTIVKGERHGAIVAVVYAVDEFPSTRSGMIQLLQNEELVDTLRVETAGAPVAVRAWLRWDPISPSGYRWTSGKGPDVQLSSGTRFTASVVTRRQRPLGLVFPLLDRGS